MTKKDIVCAVSEKFELPQSLMKEVVQATLDEIVRELSVEGRVELRNFGIFSVKLRKPRRARNPRTNKEVKTKARYVVGFKPGKEMSRGVHLAQERAARKAKISS